MKKLLATFLASALLLGNVFSVSAASPPWITYYKEMEALFGGDPEVALEYNNDDHEITLLVEDAKKADALTQLLPETKEFGNVQLKITVIPANGFGATKADLIAAAFDGNPVLEEVRTGYDPITNAFTYVIFKNKVVQFFSDNLADANGLTSTLYQTIAGEVLGDGEGIYYCTAPGDPALEMPLGEWP